MRFFNSAGLLAMLTLGSVVSTSPASTVSGSMDISVTFDEYIKQFKQPESVDTELESLDKRWVSTTCGGIGLPLLQIAAQAVQLCSAAILSLEFQDDTNRRRFNRYFGDWNDTPNGRAIIRDRYKMIQDTLYSTVFNLICLPNETNGNVIADVVPHGQGNPADVRLFQLWFALSDDNQCGETATKANVLVHEASHVFGAADHGSDQGNDAYLLAWYSSSVYGNCPF